MAAQRNPKLYRMLPAKTFSSVPAREAIDWMSEESGLPIISDIRSDRFDLFVTITLMPATLQTDLDELLTAVRQSGQTTLIQVDHPDSVEIVDASKAIVTKVYDVHRIVRAYAIKHAAVQNRVSDCPDHIVANSPPLATRPKRLPPAGMTKRSRCCAMSFARRSNRPVGKTTAAKLVRLRILPACW